MRVDIHTHILPGIDDGARDPEMSVKMLRMLEADGVTDVVLTPHFYFRSQNIETFLQKRNRACQALAALWDGKIRLHLGAEAEFSNVSVDPGLYRALSIDGGSYVLLELPYRGDLTKDILPKLERLNYRTGLTPIIAHVERYADVQKNPWLAGELVDMGCLLQVNGESVLDSRTGSLVDALLQYGQVHLLGTDCHNVADRRPEYRRAMSLIERRYGSDCVAYLTSIAQSVIRGKRVHVSAEGRIRRSFGKYR